MILESAVAVLLHLVSLAATENMAVHERDLRGVRKQDAMAEAPLTDKFKRQSSSNGIGDGGVVGSNLKGSHCIDAFDYSEKTIVRLNDSVSNGAVFIDVDIAETFELCLKWCCQTEVCNLAVWDQVEGECYLFDCGTPEDFTCVFDHHARFMSGALEVNRHQFDKISRGHQERHEQQLKGLNGGRAARGREDGGGDRSRKVSAAIEKAIEDAEGSIGMQQQQQRRGRNHCLPFLRNLHKKFERDLERHPIRLRMELVSLFILVHCLMYTCLIGLVAWQRGYNYGEAAFIFALRLIFAIRLILIVAVPICHLASIQELKFRVGGHHFPEPGISIGGD